MNTNIDSGLIHDPSNDAPSELRLAEVGERLYRAGLAWRRTMARALHEVPLTVGQYQLLGGLEALTKERPHASFSNREIAEKAGVDEQTTYRVMWGLSDRGLISRDGDECQWLNLITHTGCETLARAERIVENASERFFEQTFPEQQLLLQELTCEVDKTRWIPKRRRRKRVF